MRLLKGCSTLYTKFTFFGVRVSVIGVSRTDRWSVNEWSNNRVILWNDVLNYFRE